MNQTWTRFLPAFIRTRLEGRHRLQKIITNTGWLFTDQVIRMGVGLLVSVWVARYLGPSRFGILSYAVAFVSLLSVLATLGLDGIVVRDIVRDPSCKEETLGTAFLLKFFGGLLTFLSTGVGIYLLRSDDTLTRWLVGIVAVGTMFQAFDVVDFWFQSQIQSKFTVYAKNGAFLAMALVKVALILNRAPLIAFALAGVGELMLAAAGLAFVYRSKGNQFTSLRFSLRRAKTLLRDSWPLVLSGLAIYVQAKFDQVMLGEMVGANEVGQFSAAMKLIEVFGFIPMIIYSSVAPEITKAKVEGDEVYNNRLTNVYRLMFILFLAAAVPIFLFSERLVVMLYGVAYGKAGILLSLFAIRLFFANFGVAKGLFITNENLFKYSLISATAGALVNICLNYLLIPTYASIGAIWAMIASFAVTTFIMDLFFQKTRRNLLLMAWAIVTPWQFRFK